MILLQYSQARSSSAQEKQRRVKTENQRFFLSVFSDFWSVSFRVFSFSTLFMDSRKPKLNFMSRNPLLYCISICLLSVFTLFGTISISISTRNPCLDIRSSSDRKIDSYKQEIGNGGAEERIFSSLRRYLSGPGSSPPRCTSKCGRCTPCKPVHVPVPPGTPVTTEYYPEAWRCKCGNKLYMP